MSFCSAFVQLLLSRTAYDWDPWSLYQYRKPAKEAATWGRPNFWIWLMQRSKALQMPNRPSVNVLCQVSGRPTMQLRLWKYLKHSIDNFCDRKLSSCEWSCKKKVLPWKSDSSSSAESPDSSWCCWACPGPGTWGEAAASQKPVQTRMFYSTVLFMFLERNSQQSTFTETHLNTVSLL